MTNNIKMLSNNVNGLMKYKPRGEAEGYILVKLLVRRLTKIRAVAYTRSGVIGI